MKEKKKIPWGLIYVGLTVVVMIVFAMIPVSPTTMKK